MTVLLDTNLWVSALISASMRARIQRILSSENINILSDTNLLEELAEVCARPKFSRILSPELVASFIQMLQERLVFVETQSVFQICRDPNDDYLLAICYDGSAEFLLTGDEDLLVIQSFYNTQILTLREFESKFFPNE